jgi:exodeoxyribonuclease VII large subunit
MPAKPDPDQLGLPVPPPTPVPAPPSLPRRQAHTVSQATRLIKDALEGGLPALWVVGEISNFKRHASGHGYFSLKDEGAALAAVLWASRFAGLRFEPRDGMKVLAYGRVGVYEPRGVYQLYVDRLEPHGAGEQQAALARLCAKLRTEGLFDPGRKRPLPVLPRRIGVATSPDGAAVRDLIQTVRRRCPIVDMLIHPVRVQGVGAAEEIAGAIDRLNRLAARLGGIDLLIIGRGGGSAEDLAAFNEEIVARAIVRSSIPVVSAVGHETDTTVADLVADRRAATPTAAGELAVPVLAELLAHIAMLGRRLAGGLNACIAAGRRRLQTLSRRRPLVDPLGIVRTFRQRLDELGHAADRAAGRAVQSGRDRLAALAGRLEALSPLAVLARGYSIAQAEATGRVIRRAVDAAVGDRLLLRPAQGRLRVRVDEVLPEA